MRVMQTAGLYANRSAIPVLMYHSVSKDLEPGRRPYYQLATSPERFRRQMHLLRDRGYHAIGLSDAQRLASGHAAGEAAHPVVITFDDGFRDFLTSAWPVLEELQFAATVVQRAVRRLRLVASPPLEYS
jgi:peptidoglycan/xylan/chitin deacetylase (PgdA/CDA1 family)